MTTAQSDRAMQFRAMHRTGHVLTLPNAWDVASARIIERVGASAIATTSGGVAWSLGAADGDQLDRERAVDLVLRIAAAVDVPVTADIESGYARDAAGMAETIHSVIAAGAVGVNIEDAHHHDTAALRPVAEQCERLAAARQAADDRGLPLFINARIDTYLFAVGDPPARLRETLSRAEAYVAAGADGIFVPGVTDPPTISRLVKELGVPLNIMVGPGAPTIHELTELGVVRVSLGSSLAQAAYAVVQRASQEVLTSGTYTTLDQMMDFGDLNALLSNVRGDHSP